MCLKIFLNQPKIITGKPDATKLVDSAFIFNILNAVMPSATHIYISDNQYQLCSESDINSFLVADDTNKAAYVADLHDCDDFSYRLMGQFSTPEWSGIAFGIVWTDKHALNCLIDDKGKFYFVEPQTDALYETIQPYMGSEILFILM